MVARSYHPCAMIGRTALLSSRRKITMGTFLYRFTAGLSRFEDWFNRRFGWFFTNGMKGPRSSQRPFRA